MGVELDDKNSLTLKKLLILIIEFVLVLLIAIIIVGLVQQFVISPINVAGTSMSPTIRSEGDKVYVYKKAKSYEVGEVIVFYRPNNGVNDESKNPASKKVTFNDFIQHLPLIGKSKSTNDLDSSLEYTCVIKRVVACPGDTVSFIDGEFYCNGKKEERFVWTWDDVNIGNNYVHTLEEDEYFVLGDNRGNSLDSEDYGPIKASWINGRAVLLVTNGKLKSSF